MFTTRPEIAGSFGAVASTHWIASQVGMAVLERGGNAFDAAAAAGFTLQIVEPHLNGPGGDCPIILHSEKLGRQQVICGQGPAPRAMTVAKLKGELGLDLVPGTGFLAAPVPGAFDAWMLMLRDHGTWRLRDVLEFAIGYARRGAHMVPRVRATVETVRPLFETAWPTSAALWLRNGGPEPGGLYANPVLADTYERVVREAEAAGSNRETQIEAARNAWYRGFVAEAIIRFSRSFEALDTSGRRHAGLLTAEETGVTKANADQLKTSSKDPFVRRLLGTEGDFGKKLGLDDEWMLRAIKVGGNYGELYDTYFGPKALDLPRGLNNLWTKGGLQYALPWR